MMVTLMRAGNLMSAISAVFTIVFADKSTQWILADELIFTRLVRSLVGEVISRLVAQESVLFKPIEARYCSREFPIPTD